MNKLVILSALAVAASAAAQDTFPLPASAAPGSTDPYEATRPFLAPLRVSQTKVVDRNTLTAQGLPATFSDWDMTDFDPTGRYLFIPSETGSTGAGVFRYDTVTRTHVTLFAGNTAVGRTANPVGWSVANDNCIRLDPCTFTPFGTIVTGEETTGGRAFEVLNPLSSGPYQVRWLSGIPAMAHEGMRFDAQGNFYIVDENNSGCIYKYVPFTAGDLSVGQTFVLRVDAYATDVNARPAENWNSTSNRLTNRFGPATWVPITDAQGNALTTANPYVFVTATGGRDAADEVIGTPYGRPEDLDINVLASGNQCLYCCLTSENRVVSIELVNASSAIVREFVNFDTINLATGQDVNPAQNDPYTSPGSGTVFAAPDNVAVDHWGNVYVIEDAEPNGGDVWKCVDANRDGVAEAMGILLSLGVGGSEVTGMVFHPTDPYRFVITNMHPASDNDAVWAFDTRPYPGSNLDLSLSTGVDAMPRTGPGEFVKSAYANDIVNINVDSENSTYTGRPFAVLLQAFGTSSGTVPFLPPLWMSPYAPIIALVGGPAGQFTSVLPYGGSNTAVQVPSFLSGISVMTQGIVVTQNGALVLTDGHEIVLR